jgi:putative ubiquitin-RnfH superfamily antitoxin RatB of RatAB toxin-antitoxin module
MPLCCGRKKFTVRSLSELPLNSKTMTVEVAYAEARRAVVKQYQLLPPATVADALRLAAADPDFLGIDLANSPVGVFGRLARLDQHLHEGDRVEVYRALAADPKIARRARAKEQQRRRG